MTKQELVKNIQNYFLKLRDSKVWKNGRGGNIKVFFGADRFLFKTSSLQFEIIVKKILENEIVYDIKTESLFLKYPSKHDSYSENSILEGFHCLVDVYNSLIENGNFNNYLLENMSIYEKSIKDSIENQFQDIKDNFSIFNIHRARPLKFLVHSRITNKSRDTARPGKDTITDTSTNIDFKVSVINDSIVDSNEIKRIQDHLNDFTVYTSDRSYGFVKADTNEYINEQEILDLNLTKYVNQLSQNSNYQTKPPVEDYRNDSARTRLFLQIEKDILSLKVLIFFIFSRDKDLQGTDYKFYDLLSIVKTFKPNIVPDQDQHLFYQKLILNLNFGNIYNLNKEKIESFLSINSGGDLKYKIYGYYSNCYNNQQLFDIDSIHYAFKDNFAITNNGFG